MKKKSFNLSVFFLFALLVLLLSLLSCAAEKEIGPYLGDIAPDFRLEDENGSLWNLSDFQGKCRLLVIYHADCPYCMQQLDIASKTLEDPYIGSFYPDSFQALAVVMDAKQQDLLSYHQENDLQAPLLADPDLLMLSLYQVKTTPLILLIDSEGIIRYRKARYEEGEVNLKITQHLP